MVFTGEAAGDYFGVSVSGAGDVNNDGFDDVVVGAQWNDQAGGDAGRAYVFYGMDILVPTERLAVNADWIMTAESAGSEFGESVSGAGDLNCDGFADVIVGASGSGGLGRAYVFYGSDVPIPYHVPASAADLTFDGEGSSDEFGLSVSAAGDVNNDGRDDLIVGAPWIDSGGTDAGRAYIYACLDTTPPVVSCPSDIAVSNDPGECGAVVNFSATTTDNCQLDTVFCIPESGSFFPIGSTQVECIVIDAAGNADTCSFNVTVYDAEPPHAECPGDTVVENDPDACGAVVVFSSGFIDNCPGGSITCTPISGSFFDVGTTQVTCIAVDAAGNADTCSFTVTVEDQEPPALTCPLDTTVQSCSGDCVVVEYIAEVSDNCPGATVTWNPPSGSCFPMGESIVSCIATDAAGNSDTCVFSIMVASYACEGQFREGHKCANAVDGDWMTSAVPDAYGDSIAVIQCHDVPSGACAANWRFKVLRNWENIEVKAYYWNYASSAWDSLYDVPLNSPPTIYTASVPTNGLVSSPLKTKMHVKNASSPLVSGEYFEGEVDWEWCCCDCQADEGGPCDGVPNVFDVVFCVGESFRNEPCTPDPNPACPLVCMNDLNLDGEVNVFDVVFLVNMAYRNGARDDNVCDPCTMIGPPSCPF